MNEKEIIQEIKYSFNIMNKINLSMIRQKMA